MRAWAHAVIAAVVVTIGAPARADDRDEARREFALGQAADKQRDWQTAIEHYLRANDLAPHPFAIYNIATDYERLGKLREAATWFERYIDASSDLADREKVNRMVLALRDRPSPITIRSTPDGARVSIDGLPLGTTPFTSTLKGGPHRIVVDRDGHRDTREVKAEFGEPIDEPFVLRGASGMLRVAGQPLGALVTVDNMAAGTVPARLNLPPGEHVVRVTHPGFTPYETTVTIAANQEAVVDAALARGGLGTGPTTPTVLQVGYLLGVAGGADARGAGGLLLVELGGRLTQYDAGIRIGRVGELTVVDLLVRWTLTTGRLAPFLGAGYSFVTDGFGYTLHAGLRYDLARGEHYGISVMAETGLRYVTGTVSGATEPATTETGVIVPVMASLVVLYK